MKIPCVKFEQSDFNILNFALEARILKDISYFNPREFDRETGIQRDYKAKKSRQIAEYINTEGAVLPNNIIINLELDKLGLKLEDVYEKGELDISIMIDKCSKIKKVPEELKNKFAFVIDGQHRLRAFEFTNIKDFKLNVTSLIDLNLAQVAEIFVKINYYQRPINKSLVFDLLGISEKIFPEYYKLHRVIDKLNSDLSSPFYNNIKMLGSGDGIITQASLITAIEKYKIEEILKSINNEPSEKNIYNILWIFFTAIIDKELFKSQWESNDFILTRSVGIRALIKLLGNILISFDKKKIDFNVNNVKEALKKIPGDLWSNQEIASYGGEKGVTALYSKLANYLGVEYGSQD